MKELLNECKDIFIDLMVSLYGDAESYSFVRPEKGLQIASGITMHQVICGLSDTQIAVAYIEFIYAVEIVSNGLPKKCPLTAKEVVYSLFNGAGISDLSDMYYLHQNCVIEVSVINDKPVVVGVHYLEESSS